MRQKNGGRKIRANQVFIFLPFSPCLRSRLELRPQVGIIGLMPIYEFHCEKCERDSELLIRSSSWKGSRCPHCGSSKLSKKLSVFAASGAPAAPAKAAGGCGGGGCGCACSGRKHRH